MTVSVSEQLAPRRGTPHDSQCERAACSLDDAHHMTAAFIAKPHNLELAGFLLLCPRTHCHRCKQAQAAACPPEVTDLDFPPGAAGGGGGSGGAVADASAAQLSQAAAAPAAIAAPPAAPSASGAVHPPSPVSAAAPAAGVRAHAPSAGPTIALHALLVHAAAPSGILGHWPRRPAAAAPVGHQSTSVGGMDGHFERYSTQ
eukprot:1157586-Pelagomonas_calceolata.AAC.7